MPLSWLFLSPSGERLCRDMVGECANAKESWISIGDLRLGGEEVLSTSSSSLSPSHSSELADDAATQIVNAE